MARVERFTSTGEVAIEQAQRIPFIDPAGFEFSTAEADAVGGIGKILVELGKRKIDMQDRIGISNVNALMENAQREYEKEIIGKPIEEHAAILTKHRNNALTAAGKENLSPQAKGLADNKLAIWGDDFADTAELITLKALERDALIRTADDYGKALVQDDRETIAEAELALDSQLESSMLPAEAKQFKEKIQADAIVKMKEDAIGEAQKSALLAWQATVTNKTPKGDLQAAIDSILNDDRVSNQDKQEAVSEVRAIINAKRAEAKLLVEAQQESERNDINNTIYIDKDYERALAEVDASSLPEKEQRELFKEISSRAALAAEGEPEKNNPVAVDKVSTAIAQIGNNTLPLSKAKQILKDNSSLLKSKKVIEFTEEVNKEFDASVDTASAKVRGDVRLRAVGKTESALDRLLEALVGVKEKDKKSLEERITTAREKFELELDNFNRWEESMRAWRQTNNTASPDEILKEGMRSWFTEYSGKKVPQLRKESAQQKTDFELVRVESPDGRTGTIPKSELKRAIERGWKKL